MYHVGIIICKFYNSIYILLLYIKECQRGYIYTYIYNNIGKDIQTRGGLRSQSLIITYLTIYYYNTYTTNDCNIVNFIKKDKNIRFFYVSIQFS